MRSRFAAFGVIALLAALTVLAGCVDAFKNYAPSGPGGGPGDVTWTSHVQGLVATNHCLECHVPPNGIGFLATGFSLASYAEAIGVDGSSALMVIPGDADRSQLIWRLEGVKDDGSAFLGTRMPMNYPMLPQSTINIFRAWIDQGARN